MASWPQKYLPLCIDLVYNVSRPARGLLGGSPAAVNRVLPVAYRILGLVSLAGAACLVGLLALTALLIVIYARSGRVRLPRLAVLGGGALYSPLAFILRALGRPARLLDLFVVEAANAAMARAFACAGPVRMLAVPQCLRSGECGAPLDPQDGYRCCRCGRCPLGELGEAAERRGFRFFIVPGDRMVKRLAKRLAVDAAIGVACPGELSGAMIAGMKMRVAAAGVPLACDGCFETRVDLDRVKEAMRRCGMSSSR